MRDETLREELLPLERPFREAALIYAKRFAWFVAIVLVNLVILSCFLLFEILPINATVLLGVALLVWRLFRNRVWRVYPYFSLFVLYIVVRNLALLGIQKFAPGIYPGVYLGSGCAEIGLRFLVIWEVFRHTFTFPKGYERDRALSILATLLAITVGLLSFAIQYTQDPRSWYPALDRSFSFVQSILILAVLFIARYYGLRLGRNIRGITLAFGTWLSISTANSAMLDLNKRFLSYWQLLGSLSFLAMLGIWTWAVWTYAPNPPITEGKQGRSTFGWWADTWSPICLKR
jgi:hypothetical protein